MPSHRGSAGPRRRLSAGSSELGSSDGAVRARVPVQAPVTTHVGRAMVPRHVLLGGVLRGGLLLVLAALESVLDALVDLLADVPPLHRVALDARRPRVVARLLGQCGRPEETCGHEEDAEEDARVHGGFLYVASYVASWTRVG